MKLEALLSMVFTGMGVCSGQGLRTEPSLRSQRDDRARKMAQARQQNAAIENGDVDVRITEASQLIDELKGATSGTGGHR